MIEGQDGNGASASHAEPGPATGRWLRVDLALGRSEPVPDVPVGSPPAALLCALRIVRRAVERDTRTRRARLDPQLPLVLVAGALAGTGAVGADRAALVGISPQTGRIAEAYAEGPFAARLRAAGLDGLVLVGRAPRPSYLLVADGSVQLCDATDLWGRTTTAAAKLLGAPSDTAEVAVIGPAGEHGVAFADVVTGSGVAFRRFGFGAVFGARRLKAVVVSGRTALPPPVDAVAVANVCAEYRAELPSNPLSRGQRDAPGFGAWVGTVTNSGYHARRNFSDTTAISATTLDRASFLSRLVRGEGGCPNCPTDCLKGFAAEGGSVVLHQEVVASLGPNLGVEDPDEVLAAARRCFELGLDPVSAGGTLAVLFEVGERHGDGSLRFGAGRLLPSLLNTMAGAHAPIVCRRPEPALRRGADALARALGEPDLAMTSRGIELPPFDPRVQPGLALAWASAPAGPRYDACEHDLDFDPLDGFPHAFAEARRLGLDVPTPALSLDDARGERTATLMLLWSTLDALLLCPFASTPTRPLTWDRVARMVRAVTGAGPLGPLELGRDRFREQRAINRALGRSCATRRLPGRFHAEPVGVGRYRGARLEPAAFARQVVRVARRIG